jgi:hypothetical protein
MKRCWMALVLAAALGGSAIGQGCSQCKESVGQTPAATQRAYRRGIGVMMAAAMIACGATVVMVRRYR